MKLLIVKQPSIFILIIVLFCGTIFIKCTDNSHNSNKQSPNLEKLKTDTLLIKDSLGFKTADVNLDSLITDEGKENAKKEKIISEQAKSIAIIDKKQKKIEKEIAELKKRNAELKKQFITLLASSGITVDTIISFDSKDNIIAKRKGKIIKLHEESAGNWKIMK